MGVVWSFCDGPRQGKGDLNTAWSTGRDREDTQPSSPLPPTPATHPHAAPRLPSKSLTSISPSSPPRLIKPEDRGEQNVSAKQSPACSSLNLEEHVKTLMYSRDQLQWAAQAFQLHGVNLSSGFPLVEEMLADYREFVDQLLPDFEDDALESSEELTLSVLRKHVSLALQHCYKFSQTAFRRRKSDVMSLYVGKASHELQAVAQRFDVTLHQTAQENHKLFCSSVLAELHDDQLLESAAVRQLPQTVGISNPSSTDLWAEVVSSWTMLCCIMVLQQPSIRPEFDFSANPQWFDNPRSKKKARSSKQATDCCSPALMGNEGHVLLKGKVSYE